MAIDHLIFNKTNFAPYNNNQQAMILPKQLALPAQIKVYRKPAIDRTNVFFAMSKAGDTVNVVGKMNDYYLVQGHISGNGTSTGDFSDDVGSILISDIQNGGVLHSSINRLCHAVSRLERRLAC